MPSFKMNYKCIPVTSDFIENYMPKANAAFVKVYLYALNLAVMGEGVEYSHIASKLSLLESDVIQAFDYWMKTGIIKSEGDSIIFGIEGGANNKTEKREEAKPVLKREESTRPGYEEGQVARAISDDSSLSEMMLLVQEILGKTLNAQDTETLYWFYDGLKFSPEVILMLLEYCVSKEKRRMNYIEKVAISWHEQGITSMEAVDSYLQKEAKKSGFVYSIRKILGITDRALSQSEEQYINRWHDMYKMEGDMISLAYEQCIIQTAKLSFPYIEKILERWYKEGIHTPNQAERDNAEFRNSQAKNSQKPVSYEVYSDGYDHDDLESLTRKKDY